MATYTWTHRNNGPLRRRPTSNEVAGPYPGAVKRCNGCGMQNHPKLRVCRGCRETLQRRPKVSHKIDLDAQLKNADLRIADWHRRARIALGRIDKWTKARNRIMRKKVEEAREAATQDRATLVRPARRALRVRHLVVNHRLGWK